MKSSILFYFFFAAFLCSAFGSVVRTEVSTENECNVPSLVAYCLDLVHLGAEYEPPSAEVEELKHDVEEAPFGMCAWGHWNGKATVEDCMKVLDEYADDDDEEEEVETEIDPSGRFFKKIKKAFKKVGKKIKKGFKKVVRGVRKVVRKVSKFCRKNKKVCEAAVEIGKKILAGKKEK